MRSTTLVPALLIAASASAQTYTNSFLTSDLAPVLTSGSENQQWDISQPYSAMKPWDTSSTNGTYSISGQATLTDDYIAQYPSAAGAGGATFRLEVSLAGLSSFKVSDLGSLSYQFSIGPLQSGGGLGIALLTESGSSTEALFLGGNNATFDVNNVGGLLTITLSEFAADAQDRTFTKVAFQGGAIWSQLPGGGFGSATGQYLDYTFESVSLTLGTPVPEPSTYGLMLGGLALAGAVWRRRAKRA